MSDQFLALLDRLDNCEAAARPSKMQRRPTQRNPSNGGPARDRYRAPFRDVVYDRVEDESMFEQGQPLDSFNERLLRRPHFDRQSRAATGQARLSLAPNSSRFVVPDCTSQSPRSLGQREEPEEITHGLGIEYGLPQRRTLRQRDLSRLIYNPIEQPHDEPSNGQFAASSSPAFQASQRRAENCQFKTSSPETPRNRYTEKQSSYDMFPISEPTLQKEEPVNLHHQPPAAAQRGLRPDAPLTQGIQLVPVTELPDRIRAVFPYPIFNAVQSKCFHSVYKTDDNFVLSSPTGSGKTVVLELAICRAITKNSTAQYKIVYQAPTKALCSERYRDWQKKFNPLGLSCAELTGDSDVADLRSVQSANIIVTTPEKWDSVTRKWKDHEKLMRLVTLFLIDEVHLLKEDRGAILEAVVSRMKSIGTEVRFVALSATIPNFQDVATWLGRSSTCPYQPAINEKFGEEFRPVRLQKHVCGFQSNSSNEFGFEKFLDTKLPEVIKTYSKVKPIIVFCFTRASTTNTAKLLANWWATRHPKDRMWKSPQKPLNFKNRELRDCAASGVAFHHAGIDSDDRIKVEKAYLEGHLNVICCTSTLAVGVNLPCHLVIIKNTVTFTQGGTHEYSDLEMMQMLGRAGRPQFDDSAVAVIMTRQSKLRKYESMVTGQDLLESTLHLNLIDHLNAEIGLGTIRDLASARKWFESTFLYVRIKQNPSYYKLEGARSGQSIDEQLNDICSRDIALLREHNLVTGESTFQSTDYGFAMAQYYVHFRTMKVFLSLTSKASISQILFAIAEASEFEDIRFRSGEKALYKIINKGPYIRFPISVNLDLPAHKVSLLIQSVLGAADIPWEGDHSKRKGQYTTEALMIFKHIHRLIRCIVDCQISAGDSVSINNALLFERSLGARVWDDSPMQMKQIESLGVVAVRKLTNAKIRSLEELELTDTHRIESILGRNPPFGLKIHEKLKAFPKLRVSLQIRANSTTRTSGGVKVMVKADMGFMNDTPPVVFNSKAIYVSLLAETSDGRKAHFARTSGKKLGKGQSITFPVLLKTPNLIINCYVMCDGIAGTLRAAEVNPDVKTSMFPPRAEEVTVSPEQQRPAPNMSRPRSETVLSKPVPETDHNDDCDDYGIDDEDFLQASFKDLDFDHIDNYANPTDAVTRKNTAKNGSKTTSRTTQVFEEAATHDNDDDHRPRQLDNGKWACNHFCRDKEACRHLCCKEGMDKPPKKTAARRVAANGNNHDEDTISTKSGTEGKYGQTTLQLTASKRKFSASAEELDLTKEEKRKKPKNSANAPRDIKKLDKLHNSIQKNAPTVSSIMNKKPSYCYGQSASHDLSFMGIGNSTDRPDSNQSSDYGDLGLEDLPSTFGDQRSTVGPFNATETLNAPQSDCGDAVLDYEPFHDDPFGDGDSMMDDIMLDATGSEDLRTSKDLQEKHNYLPAGCVDDRNFNDLAAHEIMTDSRTLATSSSLVTLPILPPDKGKSLFFNDTSSPVHNDPQPEKAIVSASGDPRYGHTGRCEPLNASKDTEGTKKNIKKSASSFTEQENVQPQDDPIPSAYKNLEPWLFEEFGDIVEIVD